MSHEIAQRMPQSTWTWEDLDWDTPAKLPGHRAELAMYISSQSSYAEEAGMLIAAKLCRCMDDRDIRRLFAQQASEEARHSELFERYSRVRYGSVQATAPTMNSLLETLESTEDIHKLFMMHTMFEGIALDQFSLLREAYEDDLLGDIYRLVRADEANHVSMGILFLKCFLPNLHPDDVSELEHWCESTLPILGGLPNAAAFVEKVAPQKCGAEVSNLFATRFNNRVQQMFSTSTRKETA